MNDSVQRALQLAGTTLLRTIPEPQVSDGQGLFKDVLGTVGDTLSSVAGMGIYGPLMQEQMRVQQEMMQVSMMSNIKRSQHETEMTPVRNLRVG